jgi:hypothetical protein
MTLSTALSALVATQFGVEVSRVSVGVNVNGEIVARIRGWDGRRSPRCPQARVPCYIESVPDDYDPIAAGDGEWSAFPPCY